jgi:hypothetical protein
MQTIEQLASLLLKFGIDFNYKAGQSVEIKNPNFSYDLFWYASYHIETGILVILAENHELVDEKAVREFFKGKIAVSPNKRYVNA